MVSLSMIARRFSFQTTGHTVSRSLTTKVSTSGRLVVKVRSLFSYIKWSFVQGDRFLIGDIHVGVREDKDYFFFAILDIQHIEKVCKFYFISLHF